MGYFKKYIYRRGFIFTKCHQFLSASQRMKQQYSNWTKCLAPETETLNLLDHQKRTHILVLEHMHTAHAIWLDPEGSSKPASLTPNVLGQWIYSFQMAPALPGYQWPCSCHIGLRGFDLEPWTPTDAGLCVGGVAVTPTPGRSARRSPTHLRCLSSGNSNLRRSVFTPSKLSPLPSNIASIQRPPTPCPHRADNTRPEGTLRTQVTGGLSQPLWREQPHGCGQAPPCDVTGWRPPGWVAQCGSQVLGGPVLEVSDWID